MPPPPRGETRGHKKKRRQGKKNHDFGGAGWRKNALASQPALKLVSPMIRNDSMLWDKAGGRAEYAKREARGRCLFCCAPK